MISRRSEPVDQQKQVELKVADADCCSASAEPIEQDAVA
jgi:hypothetical protein